VIISLHFIEENRSIWGFSPGDKLRINEVEDLIAIFVKFSLNFGFVSSKKAYIFGSLLLLLLLNRREGSPSSSAWADGILVCNRQQVSLFNIKSGICRNDLVHSFKHVFEPLSLFCNFSDVEVLIPRAGSHKLDIFK
jgi:hypothetical protein